MNPTHLHVDERAEAREVVVEVRDGVLLGRDVAHRQLRRSVGGSASVVAPATSTATASAVAAVKARTMVALKKKPCSVMKGSIIWQSNDWHVYSNFYSTLQFSPSLTEHTSSSARSPCRRSSRRPRRKPS